MPGVKGRSGGARTGTGPKPRSIKYAGRIAKAEAIYAAYLETAAQNLKEIAGGGGERREKKYQAAGTIYIEAPLKDEDGKLIFGPRGGAVYGKTLVYPDLPPDEMVLIEERVIVLPPDRDANEYITDRILGKPVTPQEISGKDGGAIEVAVVGYEVVAPDTAI